MNTQTIKPLSGIRILDFSRILAWPLCTQQMSDMGAEVIKIEHPERGDGTRAMKPPELGGAVRKVSEAFAAPKTKVRKMIVRVRHPTAGEIDMIASPLKFSETPVAEPALPPRLGHHTEAVLTGLLGMAAAEFRTLRDKRVIA